MRAAEAAGVTGILMSSDCVDIYNPKTIRSTMGALYRVPFVVLPPLLLPELATALRNSKAKVIFIDNLGVEIGAASQLSLADRIQKINEIVGAPVIDGAITPYREQSAVDLSAMSSVKILAKRLNADDISYRHDRTLLAKAIDELVGELDYE